MQAQSVGELVAKKCKPCEGGVDPFTGLTKFEPSPIVSLHGLTTLTTEELAAARPRSLPRSHWTEMLRILYHYDAERFQHHGPLDQSSRGPSARGVRDCLDETRGFLDSCRDRPAREG